ncbi:MAG: YidH family protein [Nocardioidaceae bacterium]
MPTDDASPDSRFLLANERTFLAYVRTALALQAAGLAVLQFLTHGHAGVRVILGLTLVAAGMTAAVGGWLRFRDNDRRIRAGEPLRTPHISVLVVVFVALVPLLAALLLSLG